jgi:hypothetical protein
MNAFENQLSIDFESSARSYRARSGVRSASPSSAHSKPKMENVFHPEGSFIGDDRFAIKISHAGQAYLIQGTYHVTVERSFSDGTVYATFVDRINVDRIYLYRAGAYVFVPVSKTVRDRLSHATLGILSDPRHNKNLSEKASA